MSNKPPFDQFTVQLKSVTNFAKYFEVIIPLAHTRTLSETARRFIEDSLTAALAGESRNAGLEEAAHEAERYVPAGALIAEYIRALKTTPSALAPGNVPDAVLALPAKWTHDELNYDPARADEPAPFRTGFEPKRRFHDPKCKRCELEAALQGRHAAGDPVNAELLRAAKAFVEWADGCWGSWAINEATTKANAEYEAAKLAIARATS